MRLISAALAALILAACASAPAPAAAQQTQAPACSAAEHRHMDFWLGTWDVEWESMSGIPAGRGTNTVTQQLGQCVIQEDFDGGPTTANLVGRSVSLYDARAGAWRQTWVDNMGGYFALTGGREGERFVLTNTRLSEQSPYLRMVFEDITEDSLTWRWQRSQDAGATWSDSWVIRYARRAP